MTISGAQSPATTGRRRRWGVRDLVIWGALLALAWALWLRADAAYSSGFIPPGPPPGTAEAQAGMVPGSVAPRPIQPARVRVPTAGVDTTVIELGLNRDGTLEVPRDFSVAGWWSGGALPGDIGPAVIVGHVDSRSGPAVFHALPSLSPGAEVIVEDAEGQAVTFTVSSVERHPKSGFPTDKVYGPTEVPTLRLVTCGGQFDRATRSYRDNVVVFAEMTPAS